MNKITLPNYTQISNDFLDNYMSRVSGNASKIYIVICRKAIGWHKISDMISYSQLQEMTGIKSHDVLRNAIEELLSFGLVYQRYKQNEFFYGVVIENA